MDIAEVAVAIAVTTAGLGADQPDWVDLSQAVGFNGTAGNLVGRRPRGSTVRADKPAGPIGVQAEH